MRSRNLTNALFYILTEEVIIILVNRDKKKKKRKKVLPPNETYENGISRTRNYCNSRVLNRTELVNKYTIVSQIPSYNDLTRPAGSGPSINSHEFSKRNNSFLDGFIVYTKKKYIYILVYTYIQGYMVRTLVGMFFRDYTIGI